MMDQLLLIACIMGAVAVGAYFMSRMLIGKDDSKLRQRLSNKAPEGSQGGGGSGSVTKAKSAPIMQRIGTAAAKPFMPKTREKQSAIKKNLAYAGIYAPNAAKVMTGAKVILLFGGLIGGYVLGVVFDMMALGISLGGLIGYLLPTMWLKMQVKKNRQEIAL